VHYTRFGGIFRNLFDPRTARDTGFHKWSADQDAHHRVMWTGFIERFHVSGDNRTSIWRRRRESHSVVSKLILVRWTIKDSVVRIEDHLYIESRWGASHPQVMHLLDGKNVHMRGVSSLFQDPQLQEPHWTVQNRTFFVPPIYIPRLWVLIKTQKKRAPWRRRLQGFPICDIL
jgi:hypothetical protein